MWHGPVSWITRYGVRHQGFAARDDAKHEQAPALEVAVGAAERVAGAVMPPVRLEDTRSQHGLARVSFAVAVLARERCHHGRGARA